MSDGRVGRTLYRELLRWARRAEGIPVRLRPAELFAVLQAQGFGLSGPDALQTATIDCLSKEVSSLARQGFRRSSILQGDQAELELDRGFQALRLLNTAYTPQVQSLQQQRAKHLCRDGVLFAVGQVFRHKKYGYKGVICGWDRACARDPSWAQSLGVKADQPFYDVLPDEDECQRLFGATRISKYVAQENVEAVSSSHVLHRALDNYFSGFSRRHGWYIPTAALQYVYPDLYDAEDVEPIGDDSNLLMAREPAPRNLAAEQRQMEQLLVDVG